MEYINTALAYLGSLDQAKLEALAKLGYSRAQDIAIALYIYFISIEISLDTQIAMTFGVVVGLGIICFNVLFPGDPFDYDLNGAETSADAIKELEKLRKENDEELRRMGIKQDAIEEEAPAGESNDATTPDSEKAKPESEDNSGLRQRKKKKESNNAKGNTQKDEPKKVDPSSVLEELQAERAENAKRAKKLIMETKLQEIDKIAHRFDNPKVRKMMGVDEKEMKNIVKQTKSDIRAGRTPSEPILSWSGMFDLIFYGVMFAAIAYFANKDYGFNVFIFLGKYFPKEAKVLQSMASGIQADSLLGAQ
jgi:hypothetical protein